MILKHVRILIASIFGNALEFYNLTLYGFFVATIAQTFFPADDALFSLISSLSVYAVGFVIRPLGATVFGYIGDRLGRRKALGLSIFLMGIPSLIISFLPGYDVLGFLAPTILILCRVVQGLCSGGEFNGATIFALEHMGKRAPGFAGGLIVGSCLLGSLVALGIATLLQSFDLPDWGWRFAFFLGSAASFYGMYIRRKMDESPDFALMKKEDKIDHAPLKTVFSKHGSSFFKVFSIAAFDGALTYTLVTFLVVFTTSFLRVPEDLALQYNFFGIVACMLMCPLSGYWADRMGAYKMLQLATVGVFLFSFPAFWLLLKGTGFSMVVANILLGLLVGSVIGVQPIFSQSLFPPQSRYTGISFSYSLGIGIVGGGTPLLLTYLSNMGTPFAPAFYLMGFAFVFFVVIKNAGSKRS